MSDRTHSRHDELYIVHLLEMRRRISIQELCDILDLAPSTVRKKLAVMESKNLLIRSHGGAVSLDAGRDEPVSRKSLINVPLKKAIALAASELLADNQTIILAGGSTTGELSQYLSKLSYAVIYTNSILIANTAIQNHHLEVHVNSGIVRRRSGCVVGPSAEKFYQDKKADIAFAGCDSFSAARGAGIGNILVGELERRMLMCAEKRYILCDSSKLHEEDSFQLLPLSDITGLIVDAEADPQIIRGLRAEGLHVIVAPVIRPRTEALRKSDIKSGSFQGHIARSEQNLAG